MAETPNPKESEKQAGADAAPKPAAPKSNGGSKPSPAPAKAKAAPAGDKAASAGDKAAAPKPRQAGAPAAAAKAMAAEQAAKPLPEEYIEESAGFSGWMREAVRQTPSWLVSMVVHMVILLVLALWMVPPPDTSDMRQIVVAPPEKEQDQLEELIEEPIQELVVDTPLETVVIEPDITKVPEMPMSDDLEAAAMKIDLDELGLDKAPRNDLLATVGTFTGDALSGRGKGRGQLVAAGGGTAESERAVALALKWLAAHQMPDGGWSFNHAMHPKCRGQCGNPGTAIEARNAATAMALLPFLGAGQTHKEGKYKQTVKDGLYFLVSRMQISPKGGSLYEKGKGRMYAHGLCSIALCEAYAMTHDRGLYNPAQQAINFIAYAQDPVGGGWRYEPRQKGDTSVVGWQIMALKSGHMAYLRVPPVTVKKAFQYLDTVQANSGANYGYTDPGAGQATTAIGLLCRMYLGWKKDNPALQRGVAWLSKQGPRIGGPNKGGKPPSANMYYNYYATQVMRHWEGEQWDKWNNKMRDTLVKTQAQKGHEEGSWFFTGEHGSEVGGRLYSTTLATMILEVYYRHMPIYRTQSVEEAFPD